MLEIDRDGKTEERFAEVERLANEIMASINDGVGATGEIFENGVWIEGLECQVAFDGLLVAITIDDNRSFELASDIDERAKSRR